MMNVIRKIKKLLKEEGLCYVIKHSWEYMQFKIRLCKDTILGKEKKWKDKREYVDVIIVKGKQKETNEHQRVVNNLIDQMLTKGISYTVISEEQFQEDIVKFGNLFVLLNVSVEKYGGCISAIQKQNKVVWEPMADENSFSTVYDKSKEKSILFVFPSTEMSGGIKVALKHAVILHEQGYSVTIYASNPSLTSMEFEGVEFPVLAWKENKISGYFEKAVSTMWNTVWFVNKYEKIGKRYYLVQNYEIDFYETGSHVRKKVAETYQLKNNMQYITISKWCQKWLKEEFQQTARYAPNGIKLSELYSVKRDFSNVSKIRILIEGDCAAEHKKVDESFRIVEQLDFDKYEVWYMSYNAEPKDWYHVDRFLHRVPYDKVGDVYRSCHILLKSSILESFSYPPLEMMATGGYVVAVANDGNVEYLRDNENCLFYSRGDVKAAVEKIEKIANDSSLRKVLSNNSIRTCEARDWKEIEKEILALYDL